MNRTNYIYASIFLSVITVLYGCSNESENTILDSSSNTSENLANKTTTNIGNVLELNKSPQIDLKNKHYLFDVTEHSLEELKDLLSRVDEVTEASPETFNDLEIVMVLHGPDIDYFTKKNYLKNKSVVDLAAKLDTVKTIDMKVCKTTMDSLGVERKEIPDFIETVPFAPETITHYKEQGYINL